MFIYIQLIPYSTYSLIQNNLVSCKSDARHAERLISMPSHACKFNSTQNSYYGRILGASGFKPLSKRIRSRQNSIKMHEKFNGRSPTPKIQTPQNAFRLRSRPFLRVSNIRSDSDWCSTVSNAIDLY